MCRIVVTSRAIVVNIHLYALMDTTIRDPRTLTAAWMPGIIVKDVHRTKQRINTTCDGINLLSFFPAKVETQGGGGGVNMELITPSRAGSRK